MKRILLVAIALVAAFVVAGSSSARQTDISSVRLSPTVVVPQLPAALDPRLAQIVRSVRTDGASAALATAQTRGLLVTQGKVRVVVHVRAGQLAGARAAVRRAHGDVVVAGAQLIEALVPLKLLPQLAASAHVARVLPVSSGATVSTTMGLRLAPASTSTPASELSEAIATGTLGLEPAASIPDPPINLVAEGGDGQARIFFDPPDSDGGEAIVYYTATAEPGGWSASSEGSPVTVSGLTNGVEYVFTVTATNGAGTSASSAASNPATPEGGSRLEPDPPVGAARPDVPSYTPSSGPRPRLHHDTGEF